MPMQTAFALLLVFTEEEVKDTIFSNRKMRSRGNGGRATEGEGEEGGERGWRFERSGFVGLRSRCDQLLRVLLG